MMPGVFTFWNQHDARQHPESARFACDRLQGNGDGLSRIRQQKWIFAAFKGANYLGRWLRIYSRQTAVVSLEYIRNSEKIFGDVQSYDALNLQGQ
jgi:hypothetical protein